MLLAGQRVNYKNIQYIVFTMDNTDRVVLMTIIQ